MALSRRARFIGRSATGKLVVALLCATFGASAALAAEFRGFQAVPTPERMPAAQAVPGIEPVDRDKVEAAVERVFEAYSRLDPGKLEAVLADTFFDGTRVVDNVAESFPRDAKLRVLGIRSVQTLSQSVEVGADGRHTRVSVVSATVSSQLEFNDSGGGFQRLEGTNEFLLRISEPLR